MKQLISNLDFWGCTTSVLCAVHCAVLPLFLSFGVMGSQHWIMHPAVECTIILVTICFIYTSIVKTWFQTRSNGIALAIAGTGLVLIAVHHLFEEMATPIVVFGGLLLASSHVINLLTHDHKTAL